MTPVARKSVKSKSSVKQKVAVAPKSASKKTPPKKVAPKSSGNASRNGSTSKRATGGGQVVLTSGALRKALERMAEEIVQEFPRPEKLLVLGIRTRGVVLAERLREILQGEYEHSVPGGALDITLYRDDLSTLGPHPIVRDSDIPFDVTGANIILVDDVLYTGRTIRAAMDEVIDFGRPECVRLAVLVDRGGRELPIQADYCGLKIPPPVKKHVYVRLSEIDETDEVVVK